MRQIQLYFVTLCLRLRRCLPPQNPLREMTLRCILFLLLLTSCEKVINVNIKDADKVYVIEGVLTNRAGGCQVLVSRTKNFNEDNSFTGISGAKVSITDSNGVQQTIPETTAGVYSLPEFTGRRGMRYTLKVIINGQTFTASSTMPARRVLFDTVYIQDNTFFDEKLKLVNIQYTDPPGKGNSYRFLQYVNGVKENAVFIRNDDLSDGKTTVTQLFPRDSDGNSISKIKSGDTVKVEMLCIDPEVYKYWYSLDQSATGNTSVASPANPVTNISGGALGYFSAHTYQTRTITVP